MGGNLGNMKKINIGCNTLIIKDKKILLGKRKNCAGEGTWGLPGGHLQFGEDLIEAAKREVLEEIGVKDGDLELISVTEGVKDEKKHYIQVNFLLSNFSGEYKLMEPEKCEEWRYFELTDLPDLFPPHRTIIQAFIRKKCYLRGDEPD